MVAPPRDRGRTFDFGPIIPLPEWVNAAARDTIRRHADTVESADLVLNATGLDQ